jgi:hypothetical protein
MKPSLLSNTKIKVIPDKIKDTLQKVADQYTKGNVLEVVIIYKRPDDSYGLLATGDDRESVYSLERAKIQLLVGE